MSPVTKPTFSLSDTQLTSPLNGVVLARTLEHGSLDTSGRNLKIAGEGQFHSIDEVGSIPVVQTPGSSPVYLRDQAAAKSDHECSQPAQRQQRQ